MRHRRWREALALAIPLLLAVTPRPGAAILDELHGSWATVPNEPNKMEWASSADGFTVSWAPSGTEATTVHFTPSGRPGVFAGRAKAGWSMMDSMFSGDGPVNPLAGQPLYWARAATDAVYVYRLAIDDRGGLELDRYACRAEGNDLAVSLQRQTAAGAADPVELRLVKAAR